MPKRRVKLGAIAVVAAAVTLGAAGCTSSAGPTSTSGATQTGTINIHYAAWVPHIADAIALWNKSHPSIQVTYDQFAGGTDEFPKIASSVKAGNAPCLAQIPYENITSFLAQGDLMDVTKYAQPDESKFIPFTWQQVTFGGKTYGIPQDSGPVVFFYRKDLFQKYGLTVPATWAEYAADAAKLHTKDPSVKLGSFSPDDVRTFAAEVWQKGSGPWYGVSNNSWQIGVNSATSQAVAQYWQPLIDKQEVDFTKRFDNAYYPLLAKNKIISSVGASWNSALIAQGVPSEAGKWAVAPMPQWTAGANESANAGGSAVAVLKGCAYPAQAVQFATWLDTQEAPANILDSTTGGGLYPAAVQALKYPVVNKPDSFFSGQNLGQQFAASAANVKNPWAFGPNYSTLSDDMTTAFGKVVQGQETLTTALNTEQAKSLSDLKAQGISAKAAN